MKKLKKTMLCLMTCLMVIIPLNISKIYGAGLSWNDFKPKSSNEILYLILDYPHKHYTFKHFEV